MMDMDYSSFSESDDGTEVDYTPMDVECAPPAVPTCVPAAPTYEYENRDPTEMPASMQHAPPPPKTDVEAYALLNSLAGDQFVSINSSLWVWHKRDDLWRNDEGRMRLIYWDLATELGPYAEMVRTQNQLTALARSYAAVDSNWTLSLDTSLKPGEIPFKNGIYDVVHNTSRPITQADKLTTKLEYNMPGPYADPCALARIEKLFNEFIPDEYDRTRYLMHLAEAFFVGVSSEKYAVQVWGRKHNGKTLVHNIMKTAFPQLVGIVSASDLVSQKRGGRPQDWIATNRSRRIIFVDELPEGQELDGALLKELSGNGVMCAREMYGKPFEFIPVCKLFFSTNKLMRIENAGEAEASRVQTFVAPNVFVDNPGPGEKQRDTTIGPMFQRADYRNALFHFLAKHYLAYLEYGRMPAPPPESIFTGYVDKQDFLLDEEIWKRCERTNNKQDYVLLSELHMLLYHAGYKGKKVDLCAHMQQFVIGIPCLKFVTTDRRYRVRGMRLKAGVQECVPQFAQF